MTDVCEVANDRASVTDALNRYKGVDNVAVVLASDRYWSQNRDVFREYDYPCQLFSMMRMYYLIMKPQLEEVRDLLDDDLSKEIFTHVLNVRFKIEPPSVLRRYFDNNQYFTLPEMNIFETDSVFVDCGAFVGDTVERFINNCQSVFGKIYAFEPSKPQRDALLRRRERLMREWAMDDSRIVVMPFGVGSRNMTGNMSLGIMSDNIIGMRIDSTTVNSDDENAVQIVALDEILRNENVRFIKADVEGFEMEMLRGATNIIKEKKPLLAISIYHKLTDYYEIPLYIKSLVPEYRMKIRHHSTEFPETVLYCYI